MRRGHPLRALVVAAVGLLGLDAVLLVLAGLWLDRGGLIAWGVVLGLLAALPIVAWRRYVRQMDEVRGARQAVVQELRHLQRALRETGTDAVTAGELRR